MVRKPYESNPTRIDESMKPEPTWCRWNSRVPAKEFVGQNSYEEWIPARTNEYSYVNKEKVVFEEKSKVRDEAHKCHGEIS